jgi:hypothetical protein
MASASVEDQVEVLYCASYGSFGLSDRAMAQARLWGHTEDDLYGRPQSRSDPKVVQLVKSMGQAAGDCKLAIATLPAKYKEHLYIHDYDGLEEVGVDYKSYICSLVKDIDVATATREQLDQTVVEIQACVMGTVQVTRHPL